ncbi:MAG: hypothetical protein N3A63_01855 [Bacteroidetes bacterium]|nr:hypothetical protein [Bacteroidota bacterium]
MKKILLHYTLLTTFAIICVGQEHQQVQVEEDTLHSTCNEPPIPIIYFNNTLNNTLKDTLKESPHLRQYHDSVFLSVGQRLDSLQNSLEYKNSIFITVALVAGGLAFLSILLTLIMFIKFRQHLNPEAYAFTILSTSPKQQVEDQHSRIQQTYQEQLPSPQSSPQKRQSTKRRSKSSPSAESE